MIPLKQTIPDDDKTGRLGNYYSTTIASLVHVPVEDVPMLEKAMLESREECNNLLHYWLIEYDMHVTTLLLDGNWPVKNVLHYMDSVNPLPYYILEGEDEKGRHHAVIARGKRIVHNVSTTRNVVGPGRSNNSSFYVIRTVSHGNFMQMLKQLNYAVVLYKNTGSIEHIKETLSYLYDSCLQDVPPVTQDEMFKMTIDAIDRNENVSAKITAALNTVARAADPQSEEANDISSSFTQSVVGMTYSFDELVAIYRKYTNDDTSIIASFEIDEDGSVVIARFDTEDEDVQEPHLRFYVDGRIDVGYYSPDKEWTTHKNYKKGKDESKH